MRVTIDLMKKSTQIIDLSDVINPRVGDDDLLLPLHIVYGDNQTDMRGKDVEFISEDTNKQRIYVGGTCNTDTPGDNLYMGNLTFRFPANTFKADGTYDPDKTMFRIVDKATNKVISSVNVKITVMKNSIEFDFDPDKSSYDSRAETMLQDFHDKGQAMLDNIKNLNDQAKSNVSGDTAATAKEAKKQADTNAGDISDLKVEVAGARGRYADLPGREDAQDTAINQKESINNANANYAALKQKDAQQDTVLANKAGKFELEDKLAQMNLQPEGFENEAALKAKYPNGKPGIMVTVDTGHKWIWDNEQWKDFGVYQSAGFTADQLLTLKQGMRGQVFIYRKDQFVDPYTDLNTIPANTIVTYAYAGATGSIAHAPEDKELYTVITFGPDTRERRAGAYQMAIDSHGSVFYRFYWDSWSIWRRMQNTINIASDWQFVAPYTDLNTLPNGGVTYSIGFDKVAHRPDGLDTFFFIETNGEGTIKTQLLTNLSNGDVYHRYILGNTIGDWKKLATRNPTNIAGDWQFVAPYTDLNTLPSGEVIYSVDFNKVAHRPDGLTDFFFIKTSGDGYTKTQLLTNLANGDVYHRYILGDTIGSWKKLANTSDIKDQQAQPGGIDVRTPSLSLFSNFGVIGDSYASGTLAKDDGKTFVGGQENLCWPVMLARKWGTKVLRLAEPGLSTQSWLTSDSGLKKLNESDPQDIYYLCLGINDYFQLGMSYLGTENDMDQGADTFYGNYAKIIKAIKSKAPNAPIIMFGVADDAENPKAFSEAQRKIAAKFNIPFISERDDGFFTSDYYSSNMKGGHPQAPGYAAMALAIERLIQKTIITNPSYFNQYGW